MQAAQPDFSTPTRQLPPSKKDPRVRPSNLVLQIYTSFSYSSKENISSLIPIKVTAFSVRWHGPFRTVSALTLTMVLLTLLLLSLVLF